MAMKHPDPFEGMTDEEFEDEFFEALVDEDPLKLISLRLPQSVIDRSKAAAKERGVPYQVLVKTLIETGLGRLEATKR